MGIDDLIIKKLEKTTENLNRINESVLNDAVNIAEGGLKLFRKIYKDLLETKNDVKIRIAESFGDKMEATALNEKYDALLLKAQEAIKELEDFEKDKLGMKEDKKD